MKKRWKARSRERGPKNRKVVTRRQSYEQRRSASSIQPQPYVQEDQSAQREESGKLTCMFPTAAFHEKYSCKGAITWHSYKRSSIYQQLERDREWRRRVQQELRPLTTNTLVPTDAATQALVTGGISVIHCSTGAAILCLTRQKESAFWRP